MKIAIGLRTCSISPNWWGVHRIVDCNKPTLILTCLNSLLKSIKDLTDNTAHSVIFSIHDDSSDAATLEAMNRLCVQYNVPVEIIHSGKLQNFITQYEWSKKQDCDFVYCVEDDYLHSEHALKDIIEMIDYMGKFSPYDYSVTPFNCPDRYAGVGLIYPSYVLRGPNQYWRTVFHSSYTFFVSKELFNTYDKLMETQSHLWAQKACTEDNTINQVWLEQKTRLIAPISSLAIHISDETHREPFLDWKKLWDENLIKSC